MSSGKVCNQQQLYLKQLHGVDNLDSWNFFHFCNDFHFHVDRETRVYMRREHAATKFLIIVTAIAQSRSQNTTWASSIKWICRFFVFEVSFTKFAENIIAFFIRWRAGVDGDGSISTSTPVVWGIIFWIGKIKIYFLRRSLS